MTELIRIPGGEFLMGSPENERERYSDEGPQHKVVVPDFYMGRYPVTNQEYGEFLRENKNVKEPECWADSRFNQPRQPVVGVSWDEAKAYAEWAGCRLVSEAEWEYACRAGTTTRYYSGDSEEDLDLAGWYVRNSGKQTHPVGEKEPNAFGLYDMHGSVWEWCKDDWHDGYDGAPGDGSPWIDKLRGGNRVVRGGSWGYVAHDCRSAIRSNYRPGSRNSNLGFRLSRSV